MQKLVGSNFSFKNKIINGDMQVTQRGRMHSLINNGDYTADRWYSEIQNGAEEVRQEFIYSPDAGSWKDEKDPFGDGSQHNLWQFDGDAKDTNENNDGTLHGDATFIDDVLPNVGSCKVLTLDGDGDYVSTDFKMDDSKQYTLSAWFKTNVSQNGTILRSIDSDTTPEKTRGFLFLSNNNNIVIGMGDDNNYENKSIQLNEKILNNTWHHILVSIHEYDQTLYFDGKKIGIYTLSVPAGTASDYTYSIGRSGESDNYYFKGQIARTRIFLGKSLNEDEVRKIYVEDSKYIFKNHLKSIVTQDNDISKYTPFVYRFEGQDIAPYIAKQEKVTLSFDFVSNSNRDFTLKLNYPDGNEFKSHTFNYSGDKAFQKISQVIDFSDFDLTKLVVDENLGLELQIINDTDVDVADWVSVTDVQLEIGDVATEFERKSYEISVVENNAPFDLGVGASEYKWIDETNNRESGIIYTNTLNKPIMVKISKANNGSDYVDIKVDGLIIGHYYYDSEVSIDFIVQPGSTYEYVGNSKIRKWIELK